MAHRWNTCSRWGTLISAMWQRIANEMGLSPLLRKGRGADGLWRKSSSATTGWRSCGHFDPLMRGPIGYHPKTGDLVIGRRQPTSSESTSADDSGARRGDGKEGEFEFEIRTSGTRSFPETFKRIGSFAVPIPQIAAHLLTPRPDSVPENPKHWRRFCLLLAVLSNERVCDIERQRAVVFSGYWPGQMDDLPRACGFDVSIYRDYRGSAFASTCGVIKRHYFEYWLNVPSETAACDRKVT